MVVRVEAVYGDDRRSGPHYCDPETEALAAAAAVYEDLMKLQVANQLRGMEVLPLGETVEFFGSDLKSLTRRAGAQVSRLLRKHPLWPWLGDFPGLGGVHTARLMGYLRDPHRFPGARSVWHYCGLHVVDGRAPRQRRGVVGDWNPKAKTAVLMPGGIAEQIVRLRVAPYRAKYDEIKERLQRERGIEPFSELELGIGPAPATREVRVDRSREIDGATGPDLTPPAEGVVAAVEHDVHPGPLRPFQIDAIARKVAAKTFVADLWSAWRALT